MERILNIKNLNISFNTYNGKVHAVNDISFYLRKGETLGIVGESGCGKTVTSKAIINLFSQDNVEITDDSQVLFENQNILKMKNSELRNLRGNKISMIFQDPMTFLNPTMKIGQQIAESLIVHTTMKKSEAIKKSIEMLDQVEIPNGYKAIRNYPHQFSGGQRQRIMIAMALISNPQILIADEPTTALDVTTQSNIMSLINNLKTSFKTSVILVTHNLAVASEVCNRIQVMYAGQILETGTTEEIFKNPRHPYTWALLESASIIDANKKEKLYSLNGHPPDLLSPIIGCSFAPRCKYAMNICRRIAPRRIDLSDTHNVSCWLEYKSSKEG